GDHRRDGVPTDHTRGAAASLRAEFVQRDFSTVSSQPGQDRPGRDHPLVGVLCTPADGTREWLSAGQALAAMLLHATAAGANSSYLNQPVEEVAMRSELRDHLQLDGVAQLVLRVGVGGHVAATPRRYLRDLIHRPR
ncbi:MAG: Nitroreductase, partial [Frankiales bacterium]|nr:Nitroreductase [Frankiales bacterium]